MRQWETQQAGEHSPFVLTALMWSRQEASAGPCLAETGQTRSAPVSVTAALGKGNGGSKWCFPGSAFRRRNVPGLQNESGLFGTEVRAKGIPQGDGAKPHPSCCPGALGGSAENLGCKQKAESRFSL